MGHLDFQSSPRAGEMYKDMWMLEALVDVTVYTGIIMLDVRPSSGELTSSKLPLMEHTPIR